MDAFTRLQPQKNYVDRESNAIFYNAYPQISIENKPDATQHPAWSIRLNKRNILDAKVFLLLSPPDPWRASKMIREDRSTLQKTQLINSLLHGCSKDAKKPHPASADEDAKYAFSRIFKLVRGHEGALSWMLRCCVNTCIPED